MATPNGAFVDRLSTLPEAVCDRILSFLPTKDAVATGQLSRRWRRRWCRLASIDLDSTEFYAREIPSWRSQSNFGVFVDFVLPTCASRRSLRRVALRPCSGTLRNEMDRWVRLAMAGRQLEALELDFSDLLDPHHLRKHVPGEAPVRVPDSLKEMKLKHCFFDPVGFEPFKGVRSLVLSSVSLADGEFLCRFPALESLAMFQCEIKDGFAVRHCCLRRMEMEETCFEPAAGGFPLEVEAPAMEELSVRRMKGSSAMVVRRAGRLQTLNVEDCYLPRGGEIVGISLDIEAPALCRFRYSGEVGKECCFRARSPQLVEVHLRVRRWIDHQEVEGADKWKAELLAGLSTARSMTLSGRALEVLWTGTLGFTQFCALSTLTMDVGLEFEELPAMEALMRSSPFLQTLCIDIGSSEMPYIGDLDNVDYEVQRMEQLYGDYWETLDEPINCLALHLRTIEIRNFRGKKLEDELARFLATNGKALARMTVSTPSATFSGFDFI